MLRAIFVFLVLTISTGAAAADLELKVDISEQTLTVVHADEVLHVWSVSTGRQGYETPLGAFRPERMHETWYSRKYDQIPMPHSIFFWRGYAIHGTLDAKNLGRPASRGCVRLSTQDAEKLFEIVEEQGVARTRIVVIE